MAPRVVDGKSDDVRLWMAEEPEQVLPQYRSTGRGVVHIRPQLPVGERRERDRFSLAIFQQLVGVNTVIYHAPTILEQTGPQANQARG